MDFKTEAQQFLLENSKSCTQLELVERAMEHGAKMAIVSASLKCSSLLQELKFQRPDEDSKTEARWLGINP